MKGKVVVVASALLVAMTGSALAGYDSNRTTTGGVEVKGTLDFDGSTARVKTHTVDRTNKVEYLYAEVAIRDASGNAIAEDWNSDSDDDYVTRSVTADGGIYATGKHEVANNGDTDIFYTTTTD
ncbi:hypothetical protein [Paenibacillus ehimensis]|uniref:Uncharacterized protein n=1 Tax=Paenibacillus ehimensis TaxID=79264 RepID=A0ABT8V247_9BACL|nr:hypothetical protein [Paenibacillus ehimensis]MDO3675493.1 hypothetical protein [Paenibacillus ehimensis]MEC0209493.1 hypothetical protein [Paenibacillus ehimensis]